MPDTINVKDAADATVTVATNDAVIAQLQASTTVVGDMINALIPVIAGGAEAQVIAAPAVGKKNFVDGLSLANSSDTFTLVHVKDGASIIGTFAVPAKGGNNVPIQTPLIISGVMNVEAVTAGASITGFASAYVADA